MKYQTISLFAAKGAIYYVTIATMIFSRVKITWYFYHISKGHSNKFELFDRFLRWHNCDLFCIWCQYIMNCEINV